MTDIIFYSMIFILAVCGDSFFEWTLHRYFMHQPVGKFDYAFKAHAVVHHQTFKADETYHLIHEKDKYLIPMAWWNGPLLVALCQIPWVIIAMMIGNYYILIPSSIAGALYYGAYEYMHWCMHLPKAEKRLMERTWPTSWFFYRLNGHHLLHHRYMHKNFNVVLPLADLCLGTLLLRSPVHFAQATGPLVPNVQPKFPVPNLT